MEMKRTSMRLGKLSRAVFSLMCLVVTLQIVHEPVNAWFNTVIDAPGGNTGYGSYARSVLPANYQQCIMTMIRAYWSTQKGGNEERPIC